MMRLVQSVIASLVVVTACDARAFEVHVVSAVDGQKGPPDPSEKLVREGTRVTLYAVVGGSSGPLTADVPEVILTAKAAPKPARARDTTDASWHVQWFRIEPTDHSLSNTDPTFHWQEIHYVYAPIPACDDKFSCAADLHTATLDDRGGLGTMTFRAVVTHGAETAASAGFEERYRGGLRRELPRVTVRRDDTYLGYLTEMFNTPYIWGSAGEPSSIHQTDRRIGSDCADFVTYGVRRMGYEIPYTSTWGLPKYTRQLFASSGPDANGVYLDTKGQPIVFGEKGVRPGDLLLFPGHVAAIERDAPPLGVLSTSDVMIHTSWHEPTEQSIGSSDYSDKPVKVVRWKVFDK